MKILRNVYTTQLAIVGPSLTQFKANHFLLDLDLDQKLGSGAPRKRGGLLRISPSCLSYCGSTVPNARLRAIPGH